MSWIRMDDGYSDHPKILALSDKERSIHVRMLCYAARRQDPTITTFTFGVIQANRKDVDRLVSLRLLDEVEPGVWELHDWHEYQRSIDMTGKDRQARRRERMRGEPASDYQTDDDDGEDDDGGAVVPIR